MHTIWPAYEGSVRTSWYPVMAVLNTTSPSPTTSAPSDAPTNALPSSKTSAACGLLSGNDHRLVDALVFRDENLDPLRVGRRDVLTYVVGTDGQLAVAAIDQHRELDRSRAAEVHERVHRGASGAAAVDDVVDEHDDLAVDRGHVGLRGVRGLPKMSIVAMPRDVEPSKGHRAALHAGQDRGEPARQHVALADDTDEHDVLGAPVALDYL